MVLLVGYVGFELADAVNIIQAIQKLGLARADAANLDLTSRGSVSEMCVQCFSML